MPSSLSIWRVVVYLIILLILVIILGAAAFHHILGTAWDEAFYNTVIIFTTVDVELKPLNTTHKLVIAIYTFVSVSVFLVLISVIAGWLISKLK